MLVGQDCSSKCVWLRTGTAAGATACCCRATPRIFLQTSTLGTDIDELYTRLDSGAIDVGICRRLRRAMNFCPNYRGEISAEKAGKTWEKYRTIHTRVALHDTRVALHDTRVALHEVRLTAR
jgi:hypothetical protein